MSVGFWREPSVTVALGNGRIVPDPGILGHQHSGDGKLLSKADKWDKRRLVNHGAQNSGLKDYTGTWPC